MTPLIIKIKPEYQKPFIHYNTDINALYFYIEMKIGAKKLILENLHMH